MAAFTEHAVAHLQRFEVRLRVIDLVGDTHERVCNLLTSAHLITGVPLSAASPAT